MPIERDALGGNSPSLPVKPGTNAHAIMQVLIDHPDLGFTQSELAELTDVPSGSLGKTLSRLADRNLVERVDGYWLVADETHADYVGGLLSLDAVEARYGDDYYGRDDEWAEDQPDLGDEE